MRSQLARTSARGELLQAQLERAQRDARDLRENVQASERALGEARSEGRRLALDLERVAQDKRDVLHRADAARVRLLLCAVHVSPAAKLLPVIPCHAVIPTTVSS